MYIWYIKQREMNRNIPQHIQDKANRMIAKGSVRSFDEICTSFLKDEAKKTKKETSAKDAAKWAQRGLVNNMKASGNPSVWLAEKNRENALKSLPSFMRNK